ncbi:MAG TPA: glycosyltransferase family 4 protein [Solirubrobacterales bacterium]|jgi:glycosyltransferase involved in cell wall biosynthesis|nr:glycosyltransferase family 4 protein [Solirubrobacterales bacterium]
MKILLVTSLPAGGPLEHSLILARALGAAGAEVEAVCAAEATAARFEAAGARAHVLALRHLADAVGGARLERLARRFDVVHGQDRRSGLWTRVWPRRGGPLRVYTVHGLPNPYLPVQAGGSGEPGLRDRLAYRGLDAALARRSDAVVVPSRFLRDELVGRLGFPAERLTVIPNGVEPLPAQEPGALVGTISVLEPVKGLDTFVRAAAAVVAQRPGTRFAIFGEGSSRPGLEALAREQGLAAAIEFPGHVPAPQALSRLGLYVLCSWLENAPISLLEAMSAGVPAVATGVGGVPEIAADTVPLLAPGDEAALAGAILATLEDPAAAAAAAGRARQRVLSEFSAERNASSLLALYERLQSER